MMHPLIPPSLHLSVPFLCGRLEPCSEASFYDYPNLHAFAVDSIIAKGQNVPAEELGRLAAFLQAWLVFGLLRKLLGPSLIDLQLPDFVVVAENLLDGASPESSEHDYKDGSADYGCKATSPTQYVSMAKLPLYILYLFAMECYKYDPDRRERLWEKHRAVFSEVNYITNKLILWRRMFYPPDAVSEADLPVIDIVILSVVLLNETLLDAYQELFTVEDWYVEWHLDNVLHWYLTDAGWCQGEVSSCILPYAMRLNLES